MRKLLCLFVKTYAITVPNFSQECAKSIFFATSGSSGKYFLAYIVPESVLPSFFDGRVVHIQKSSKFVQFNT